VHQPTHRGRGSDDGQDPLQGFEYRPYEAENPLSIDPDIVRSIEREWGYSLLWVCYECNGKPFPNLVSACKRNGYAEVKKGNFGGGCRRLNAAVISEIFFCDAARPAPDRSPSNTTY
jgi:hypothetical protein